MFALIVTVHVVPLVDAHPLHETNGSLPEALGAVSVTLTPALYVRVKLVVPVPRLFASNVPTVIATPLAGFVEFTVNVYVTGGGVELPPPPHPAIDKLIPATSDAALKRTNFIGGPFRLIRLSCRLSIGFAATFLSFESASRQKVI